MRWLIATLVLAASIATADGCTSSPCAMCSRAVTATASPSGASVAGNRNSVSSWPGIHWNPDTSSADHRLTVPSEALNRIR